MKTRSFLLFLLLVRVGTVGWCETIAFSAKNGRNQIRFFSKAPVEDFDGVAQEFRGMGTFDENQPDLGLTGEVVVQTASLDTGLAMRDQHMRSDNWLNAARYPSIRFDLDSAKNVKKTGKDRWSADVAGKFSLKTGSRDIVVPMSIQRTKNAVIFEGSFSVSLKDHGIHGPAAMNMIGMRVGNDVKVTFKLVGKPLGK